MRIISRAGDANGCYLPHRITWELDIEESVGKSRCEGVAIVIEASMIRWERCSIPTMKYLSIVTKWLYQLM
jgi:hypothetical protein